MTTYNFTPTGLDIQPEERAALAVAVADSCPAAHWFTGYTNFVHGETTNHRSWFATYQSVKGRTKRVMVLKAVPVA